MINFMVYELHEYIFLFCFKTHRHKSELPTHALSH